MGSFSEDTHVRCELIVNAIEEKARRTPLHTFLRYPATDWSRQGYHSLTYSHYAKAIDRLAYWLDENLPEREGIDTIAYLGPNDLRYTLLLPAAIKTKRKLLVLDGRIADNGLKGLLDAAACVAWVYAKDGPPLPSTVSATLPYFQIPAIEWCLDVEFHKPYPYLRTWDEGKLDPALIIHTSGTTGTPKPIFLSNGFLAVGLPRESSRIHWPRGINYDVFARRSLLCLCPLQWLGGIGGLIMLPILEDVIGIILPPEQREVTPQIFEELCQRNNVEGIMSPPHTIVQLFQDAKTRPLLENFEYIMYAGAALDRDVGDALAERTRVISIIGSTETGSQIGLLPMDRRLWYTYDFVPENGHKMVKVDSDTGEFGELYELFIERPENLLFQSAFWNIDYHHLTRIETKELYAPVQDIDGSRRWVFATRKDDLTKLSWLAKFHAKDIEADISRHHQISGVFVGGEGRPVPFVIVEVKQDMDSAESRAFIDELYETLITQRNKADVAEIRIPKETILLTTPAKPLKRTAKLTLQRKDIEKDFQSEIEEAYALLGGNA